MLTLLQFVWEPVAFTSGITTVFLLLGGARRRRAVASPGAARFGNTFGQTQDPDMSSRSVRKPNVACAIRRAVDQVRDAAACQGTVVEIAAAPDLAMGADPLVIGRALEQMIGQAVRRSPGGRVLVGAAPRGGRIHVIVADDADASDAGRRRADLREPESLIALQGGSLELSCRPGEGAIVTLHLPLAPAAPSRADPVPVAEEKTAPATAPQAEPAIFR